MVILDQLINDGDLSLLDQAIISYVYFVNHNNDAPKTAGERVCHATNDWLAIKFSCSKRTIINAIKRLEEKEWIKLFRQVETIGCMQIEKRYMWVNEEKLSALGEADIKARLEEVKMRRSTHLGGEEISLGGVKELQYTPVKNLHGVGCQNCNDIKKDLSEEYIERSEDICTTSAKTYVNSRIEGADAPVKASFDHALINSTDKQAKEDLISEVIRRWNEEVASVFNLAKVVKVTTKRKKAIKLVIETVGSVDNWILGIKNQLTCSPFHRGKNDRRWKADFDYYLRTEKALKALEGAMSPQVSFEDSNDEEGYVDKTIRRIFENYNGDKQDLIF